MKLSGQKINQPIASLLATHPNFQKRAHRQASVKALTNLVGAEDASTLVALGRDFLQPYFGPFAGSELHRIAPEQDQAVQMVWRPDWAWWSGWS